MISFGSSKKTTNTSQQSQSEPWAPAIPYLSRFLGDLDAGRSVLGPSGDQLDAFARLKENAAAGNPWAPQINQLATDTLGTSSRSGMVDDAYATLRAQLGDVAGGRNQDIMSDPRIAAMLAQVGDDVQSRITGAFAAAGRDITGNAAGQGAIARGVTAAQLPILMQEFARQQGRTDDAIRALFSGGTSAAQTGQALDANALATRASGLPVTQAALQARDLAPNTILNLDEQLKRMPFEDMSLYAQLLLPTAGLGGQQAGSGTQVQKGTSSGINLGLGDIGKIGTAIGTLSDEKAKEGPNGGPPEPVGKTFDGQTIYRYRYKGDPTGAVHMGLIAQEVEQVAPEAVGQFGSGMKGVDYRAATEEAVRQAQGGY